MSYVPCFKEKEILTSSFGFVERDLLKVEEYWKYTYSFKKFIETGEIHWIALKDIPDDWEY